jgi:hypothetical protein
MMAFGAYEKHLQIGIERDSDSHLESGHNKHSTQHTVMSSAAR